jgi:pimeloyl-ACP methyl ester carboxylesterase
MTKLPPTAARFANVYLFHGKGGSPDGSVLSLEAILQHAYYDIRFERPLLPHTDPEVKAEASLDWAVLQYRKQIVPNSLIIGISLGGLIAARLQELSPQLNLSVIPLMSPTWADNVRVEEKWAKRVAFYSSEDKQIEGRTNWPAYAQAFDLPMLRYHDVKVCKFAICYLISRYIAGPCDMAYEVNHLFPTDAELQNPSITPA